MNQVTVTMEQEIAALRAENARLKANKTNSLGIKVSEKGAVSVYGLGRFPVTLYAQQWENLLGKSDDIKSFILANTSILATKGE